MNNYKSIENMLYNYKADSLRIVNIDRELKNDEVIGISGVSYDGIGGGNGEISDTVAREVNNRMERQKKLLKEKKEKKEKLNKIDEAIKILPPIQQQIINEFYIENKQWWQVAGIVKYSERQCRRMRLQAIKTIEAGIFG